MLAALAQFPSVLATAADDRQPHKVARYLEELAATYHKWYNVERVVPMALTDPETRGDDEARKALEIAKNPEPARAAARLKLNDAVSRSSPTASTSSASPPPKRCDYAYFSNLAGRYGCECRRLHRISWSYRRIAA